MRGFAVLFAGWLAVSTLVAAQTSKSTVSQFEGADIYGQLQQASGFSAPLMGIKIVIQTRTGAEVARTTTDSRGRFEFRSMAPGVYLVSVRQQGYLDRPQQVDVSFAPQARIFVDLIPTAENAKPGGSVDADVSRLSPEASRSYAKGVALLFKQKKANESIAEFKRVEKLEPQFAGSYIVHGFALLDLGKFPEAESMLSKGLKKSPDDFYANFYLGVCLNSEGKFADAERVLRKALEKKQNSAEANYELSRSLFGQGRWQDAEAPATECNKLSPEFAPVHVVLGNISLRKRDANGALQHFREYMKLDPKGPFSQQTQEMIAKIEAALSKQH